MSGTKWLIGAAGIFVAYEGWQLYKSKYRYQPTSGPAPLPPDVPPGLNPNPIPPDPGATIKANPPTFTVTDKNFANRMMYGGQPLNHPPLPLSNNPAPPPGGVGRSGAAPYIPTRAPGSIGSAFYPRIIIGYTRSGQPITKTTPPGPPPKNGVGGNVATAKPFKFR